MDFKNKIVLNLEWANKRLKLQGLELNETQLEIIEFCLLSDAEQLKLCEVGVRLKEKNTPTFESWIKENCHQTKNKNLFIKDEKLLTRIELASIYERLKSDL